MEKEAAKAETEDKTRSLTLEGHMFHFRAIFHMIMGSVCFSVAGIVIGWTALFR